MGEVVKYAILGVFSNSSMGLRPGRNCSGFVWSIRSMK